MGALSFRMSHHKTCPSGAEEKNSPPALELLQMREETLSRWPTSMGVLSAGLDPLRTSQIAMHPLMDPPAKQC